MASHFCINTTGTVMTKEEEDDASTSRPMKMQLKLLGKTAKEGTGVMSSKFSRSDSNN